jgi:hypothetical protein
MKAFTSSEIGLIKSILENADDETLFELFGTDFETVKAIIQKKKEQDHKNDPYIFHQRFGDLN